MPFGDYADFADCVAKNADKENPEGWCAELHKKITGEYPAATKSEFIGTLSAFIETHPDFDLSLKGIESIIEAWTGWTGGHPGDFSECVKKLEGKEGISDPDALCAWLEHEARGKWPAEKGADVLIVHKSEAQRLVFGPVMVPGEPDSEGEVVSAEKVEEVAIKFMEDFRYVDLSHSLKHAGVPVLSELLRRDETFGDLRLPKGTWMLGVRVDKETWPRVVKGELKGFSIMAIPKAEYNRIAAKGLPLGAKWEGGQLKKVLLSDLGPDWMVAAVSILENPSVKKSRYVSIKGRLLGLLRRFAIKDQGDNKSTKQEEDDMTPEELTKLIDERVEERLKAKAEEEAKAKAAAEDEEKKKAEEATKEPPPPPPATAEQVTELNKQVEAVKGTLKSLQDTMGKVTQLVTKSRQISFGSEEAKTDRDLAGRKVKG